MGRVKSVAIKTLGRELMIRHKDRFSDTFEKNKVALKDIQKIESKRVRNILAGYITTKMKTKHITTPHRHRKNNLSSKNKRRE